MDRALALVLLALLAPVFLLLWVVLYWRFHGRPLYCQRRRGQHGRVFWIYKFRTLAHSDAAPSRLGRWLRETCLDELPQLVNVLRGEMRLVGPRPLSLEEARHFEKHITGFGERHRVKPGLTGLAQLRRGWGPAGEEERALRLADDLHYIRTRSPLTDVMLLYRTPLWVLQRILCFARPERCLATFRTAASGSEGEVGSY